MYTYDGHVSNEEVLTRQKVLTITGFKSSTAGTGAAGNLVVKTLHHN
jgi:hypothetical protein